MLSRRLLRIKTVKALYSYFQSAEDSIDRSEKELQASLSKSYELYLRFLSLPAEVADMAVERIEQGRAKLMPTEADLNPNMRFAQNRVVGVLRESGALAEALKGYPGAGWRWQREEGIIKKLYADFTAAPYYKAYMEGPEPGFSEDKQLIIDLLTHQIEDRDYIEEALEEESILWIDDIGYCLGLAIRTIGFLGRGGDELSVMPMYKNEEDSLFANRLLLKALEGHTRYFEYIDRFTRNWDFERIAFMDKLIMLAAITELVEFDNIPVKVTLDEYIEISKYYSTQSSSVFVNGILDKIVAWLSAEGLVVKSGRGLVDTKVASKAVKKQRGNL